MVDVGDSREGQGGERLQQRVERLTRELDSLDKRLESVTSQLRAAVPALLALASQKLAPEVQKAAAELRAQVAKKPLNPTKVGEAIDRLKSVMTSAPDQAPNPGGAAPDILPDPKAASSPAAGSDAQNCAPEEPAGVAARHILLALLQMLRTGDTEFDGQLEQVMDTVESAISGGEVRPVMSVLADLMDQHRHTLEKGQALGLLALKEVVQEIITAQGEVLQSFAKFQEEQRSDGRNYLSQVGQVVTRMLQEIDSAGDLNDLRVKAVQHIRALRNTLRVRVTKEEALYQKAQGQLSKLKNLLMNTKTRMAKVEEINRRVSKQAYTDPMTGLMNKRALTVHLNKALISEGAQPVCLIVFDIDHFKEVNDTYGHKAGDKALKVIAERARSVLRPEDLIFRYAGDEFVVLLRGTSLGEAKVVGERVRHAAMTTSFTYAGQNEMRVTLSLGVAQYHEDDDEHSIFFRADQALLAAKRLGRNQVALGE